MFWEASTLRASGAAPRSMVLLGRTGELLVLVVRCDGRGEELPSDCLGGRSGDLDPSVDLSGLSGCPLVAVEVGRSPWLVPLSAEEGRVP